MRRLSIDVSFDPVHGYIGTAPELRSPVRALSLNGLRKQVEDQLAAKDPDIRLVLDRDATVGYRGRSSKSRPQRCARDSQSLARAPVVGFRSSPVLVTCRARCGNFGVGALASSNSACRHRPLSGHCYRANARRGGLVDNRMEAAGSR